MKKEILVILEEIENIESSKGPEAVKKEKITEICEAYGVSFEELRNYVLEALANRLNISASELERFLIEKIGEDDLVKISGGVSPANRTIAAAIASLSCLTSGAYANLGENVQSTVTQPANPVIMRSNQSQKTSKSSAKNKVLKEIGVSAAALTILIGGGIGTYKFVHRNDAYYASVYSDMQSGVYTASVLDIYKSIPGKKRSEVIIGVLPIGNGNPKLGVLHFIPPTEEKATAFKYFVAMWEKANGYHYRSMNDVFLVYADGHIDTKNKITGAYLTHNPDGKALGTFLLKFRDKDIDTNTDIHNITVKEISNSNKSVVNSDKPTMKWFYVPECPHADVPHSVFVGDAAVEVKPADFYFFKGDLLKIKPDKLLNFFNHELIRNQHYDMEYEFNADAEYKPREPADIF